MKTADIKKVGHAYLQVIGEKTVVIDPVDKKAVKKDFDDREDKDIDNDGKVDSTDKYLHNRRKAVTKSIKNKDDSIDEAAQITKCDMDKISSADRMMKKTNKSVNSSSMKEAYEDVRLKYINQLSELGQEIASAAADLEETANEEKHLRDFKYIVRQMEDLHDMLVSADMDLDAENGIAAESLGGMYESIDMFIESSVEYVQELSKKTLGSYINKSSDEYAQASADFAKKRQVGGSDRYVRKDLKKMVKRQGGINRAVGKLTKEDTKESSMAGRTVYNRILEKRDAHTKGATPPQPMDDTWSDAAKKFVDMHGGLKGNESGIDGVKAAADTAKAAANSVKKGPVRRGDNTQRDSMQAPKDTTKS